MRRMVAIGAVVAGLLFVGCRPAAVQTPLNSASNIPAAQGEVKVKPGDSGNRLVEVRVKHLAPPERIQDGATKYVVWVRPSDREGPPQNVGMLALDKDLQGTLTSITPHKQFEVFITAEPNGNAVRPTGDRMLWTNVTGSQ